MSDSSRSVEDILEAFKGGDLNLDAALEEIRGCYFQDLGHSTVDHDREQRTGAAEVIYGEYKTPEQIAEKFHVLAEAGRNVLATRVNDRAFDAVRERVPGTEHHPTARMISLKQVQTDRQSTAIAVITAGTSDLPVAEEAAITAEFYDNPVLRINDVGVAGVHRLLARIEEIRETRVIVVVAGMEGALPSVVGGLVDKPVIAVPTSVGYGASFNGIAALLGMLNSCASGVSVVNIDNGFGAGFLASTINRL
ncbi:MAG: nickel pincer cofactor biosynthesis protein LarB [Gammaproteobacteria bacterium]|nr:nickel pincer cofactor biosynthesis protein LarB [Gammaproteobacteria bacterium]